MPLANALISCALSLSLHLQGAAEVRERDGALASSVEGFGRVLSYEVFPPHGRYVSIPLPSPIMDLTTTLNVNGPRQNERAGPVKHLARRYD